MIHIVYTVFKDVGKYLLNHKALREREIDAFFNENFTQHHSSQVAF